MVAVGVMLAACNARPGAPAVSPTTGLSAAPTEGAPVAPTTPPASGSGQCANPLLPVESGATWRYASAANGSGASSFTIAITGARSDGFTASARLDDNTVINQKWSCKPEGLALVLPGAGQSAQRLSIGGLEANLTISNATGVILPANIQPGMTWPYGLDLAGTLSQGSLSANLTGNIATEFRAIGSETVNVPAGTFEAMKLQGRSTVAVTADYHGLKLPITSVIDTTLWFAPGVGWVKSTATGEFAGTTVDAGTELQSYTIP